MFEQLQQALMSQTPYNFEESLDPMQQTLQGSSQMLQAPKAQTVASFGGGGGGGGGMGDMFEMIGKFSDFANDFAGSMGYGEDEGEEYDNPLGLDEDDAKYIELLISLYGGGGGGGG